MVVHLFLNNNKALDFLPIHSIKNGGITIFVAKKQLGTSRGMPWQDGFSAMHFYNKLKNIIPQQSNSSLDAIHYASPGYMKMRMDSDIANTTYEAIEKYKQEKSIIDPIYNELSNRIKELDLNSFATAKAINEFSLDSDCQKSYKLLKAKLYCKLSLKSKHVGLTH